MSGFTVNPASLEKYANNQIDINAQNLLDVRNFLISHGRNTHGMDGALKFILNTYLNVVERQLVLLADMNSKLTITGKNLAAAGETYMKEDLKHATAIDATLPSL